MSEHSVKAPTVMEQLNNAIPCWMFSGYTERNIRNWEKVRFAPADTCRKCGEIINDDMGHMCPDFSRGKGAH